MCSAGYITTVTVMQFSWHHLWLYNVEEFWIPQSDARTETIPSNLMPPSGSWNIDATDSSKTLVSTRQYTPQVLCDTVIQISYKPWKGGRPTGLVTSCIGTTFYRVFNLKKLTKRVIDVMMKLKFLVKKFCQVWDRANASYVYRTVHHLDSWIKRDQLDGTCFIISLFNAQHVSNVSTSILRSTNASACIRIPLHPSRTTP